MAGFGVNKCIIVGRMGRDPEIRSMNNGNRLCNITLATTESWTKNGQKQEKTEWHRVVIFVESTVGFMERYTSKGDILYVEGKLQTRKWTDTSGADRYTTEIVVTQFEGMVRKIGRSVRDDEDDADAGEREYGNKAYSNNTGFSARSSSGIGGDSMGGNARDAYNRIMSGDYEGGAGGSGNKTRAKPPSDYLDDEIPF